MPRHRLLALLPPALLLAGAANHFYLVHQHGLSPWLAGGFGMFASSDVGASRLVTVAAETATGEHFSVNLDESLDELKKRVRGLPSRDQAAVLVNAILADLGYGARGVADGDLVSLSITVWRTTFEPGSLRPSQNRIATHRFDVNE